MSRLNNYPIVGQQMRMAYIRGFFHGAAAVSGISLLVWWLA